MVGRKLESGNFDLDLGVNPLGPSAVLFNYLHLDFTFNTTTSGYRDIEIVTIATTTMAMRVSNRRALASAVRLARTPLVRRNGARPFTSTTATQIVVSPDTPNMRHAQREPDSPGGLRAPPINPADKYAAKADDMHRYGAWLMGCLPKYVQQFSVWKDELVIYISPAGVIPVFSFLKCKGFPSHATWMCINPPQTTLQPSSPRFRISRPWISLPARSDSKLCITS